MTNSVAIVDGRQPRYLGSIPIARSTFRCLACPSVVLGRDSAYRPVPTVRRGYNRSCDRKRRSALGRVRSRWSQSVRHCPSLPFKATQHKQQLSRLQQPPLRCPCLQLSVRQLRHGRIRQLIALLLTDRRRGGGTRTSSR